MDNLEAIPAFCSAQGLCLHISDQVLSHPSGPALLPKALEDLMTVLPSACEYGFAKGLPNQPSTRY